MAASSSIIRILSLKGTPPTRKYTTLLFDFDFEWERNPLLNANERRGMRAAASPIALPPCLGVLLPLQRAQLRIVLRRAAIQRVQLASGAEAGHAHLPTGSQKWDIVGDHPRPLAVLGGNIAHPLKQREAPGGVGIARSCAGAG